MLRFQNKRIQRANRRGVAGMWGIVCLIIATAMAATIGRLALTGNRLVLQEHRRSQCDWLVDAGRALALSRLRNDPKYTGETWNISAEQLEGSDPGEVVIEVQPVADSKPQIRVIGRFPKGSPHQVQVTSLY